MQIKLFRVVEQPVVTQVLAHKDSPYRVRIWRDVDAERRAMDEARERLGIASRRALEDRRPPLLKVRQVVAEARERVVLAEQSTRSRRPEATLSELSVVAREPSLAEWKELPEFSAFLFYLFRNQRLTGRALETASKAIGGVPFTDESLELFYDVAVLHQEAGDPAVARRILKLFLEEMRFDFRDVTERCRALGVTG